MKKIVVTALCLSAVILLPLVLSGCGSSTIDDDTNGDKKVSEFTVFTAEDGLADNTVTDVVVDYLRKGVWCATLNGISFYSTVDSTWFTFGAEYDIPKMEVNSITIDFLTGDVWAGTTSGPASYGDSTWTALAEMDSLVHRYITTITTLTDGSIWFGTKGGVSRRDYITGWTSYTAASGLAGDQVSSITVSAVGEIWVGTATGISVFDGEDWTQYGTRYLPSTDVRVVYRGYDGGMWCGTSNGIAVYDGVNWSRYSTADGVPSQGINGLVEDRNKTIWAATDGGAAQFIGGKWHKLDLPAKVENERALCLAADVISGVLWIGTSNGLVRYFK